MLGPDKNIHKLPSVPEVLLQTIDLSRRPGSTSDQITSILRHDAALVARVLSLDSTAPEPSGLDIEMLGKRVEGLGIEVLGSIASSMAVEQFYSRFWSGRDQHLHLWSRSLECACTARVLAQMVHYPQPDEAYFAGLLHNLGQLICLAEFPQQYAPLIEADEQARAASEKKLLGSVSTEIATSEVLAWVRDAIFSDAILFQNSPASAVLDSPELIRLINLSCKLIKTEPWEDKTIFDDAQLLLDLNPGQLLEVRTQARSEQREIISDYGLLVDEKGVVKRTKGARKALSDHVYDTALVGGVDIAAADDAWQALVREFATLFDVSGAIAFEYDSDRKLLYQGRYGSLPQGEHFKRLEIPVRPGRNLLAEACLRKTLLTTLDEGLPSFDSVLYLQLQRILGAPELAAMPVLSGEKVLGLLVAGLAGGQIEDLRRSHSRLAYFLSRVATQVEINALTEARGPETVELQLHEYLSQTRQLIHEANNPLGVVANYLQILSLKFEQDHETQKQIDVIKGEIDRVAAILSSMREVPRDANKQKTTVDINKLLEELVSIFRVSLFEPGGIECVLRLDPRIHAILSIPAHLKQVATNLLKNSVEALEAKGKGTITIETNDAVYFDGRQGIRIVVADNGPGIAPNIIGHIFTSAISSKGRPHSGVGLLIVKRLVSEMGGNIMVYSTSEEGTRFELFIPRE